MSVTNTNESNIIPCPRGDRSQIPRNNELEGLKLPFPVQNNRFSWEFGAVNFCNVFASQSRLSGDHFGSRAAVFRPRNSMSTISRCNLLISERIFDVSRVEYSNSISPPVDKPSVICAGLQRTKLHTTSPPTCLLAPSTFILHRLSPPLQDVSQRCLMFLDGCMIMIRFDYTITSSP